MIKAFIFDLDGVIVDTAKYHYIAWKQLASNLGFDFSEHDNEQLKGVSRMTSLEILLKIGGLSFSKDEKLELADKKNQRYRELIEQMTPEELLPGIMDFLNKLKKSDYKLAIGSASKNTPTILDRIGLGDFFDAVVDGNKISEAKPNPEVFLKGAEEMKMNPAECVVFEDAVAGVQAAINAGMLCVGVGDRKILSRAHHVIPSFQGVKPDSILHVLKGAK